MSLPNISGDRHAHVERRLHHEETIWLTTVRADGQPQTSPVGFVWDGAGFVIISQPSAPKVRNLRDNRRVSLHLDIDSDAEDDGGVLTLEGLATLDTSPMTENERSAYLHKYLEAIRSSGMTPEQAFAEFAIVIRVTPVRARAY